MLLAGCGGETTTPQPSPYAQSPDAVVEALAKAYDQLDPDALELVLAPDFVFLAAAADVDSGVDSSWTRDYELTCARNLLSGQEGRLPNGALQPPLDTSFPPGTLLLGVPGSSWTAVGDGDFERHYFGFMQLQYTTGDLDFIEGEHRFVVARVTDASGSGYVLRTWQDYGLPSPGDVRVQHRIFSWGFLKWIFSAHDPATR